MARRRRGGGPELTIIYWSDIPAQVTGSAAGTKAKAMLADRFQHAIDRAAAVAGKTDTEPYVAEWRKVSSPLAADADLDASVQALAAELEATYPRERVEALVQSGGVDEDATFNDQTEQNDQQQEEEQP